MKAARQQLAWALGACRQAQMRLTPLRHSMLAYLAAQRVPVSLERIGQAEGVRGQGDATTIYRTQMLFQAAGIVRQVGTTGKTSLFLLNAPGDARQFLICRGCGLIQEVALPDLVVESLRQAASSAGFSGSDQDCVLYGLCPACVTRHRLQPIPSKLAN